MRIKAKSTIKHHPYYLSAGDIVNVDDASGAILVANGWAENIDTGENNAPSLDPSTLAVDTASHKTKDKVN